jgi:hypothetical protein
VVAVLCGLVVVVATGLSARLLPTDARRPDPVLGAADSPHSTPGESRGRRTPADLTFKEVALVRANGPVPAFVAEPGPSDRTGTCRPGHRRRLDRPPIA